MRQEDVATARNHAFELMLSAQSMMDYAESEREKRIADYLYSAAWGAYWLMVEIERVKEGAE